MGDGETSTKVQDDPIHAQLLSHPHAVRASWREIQHHHDSQSVYFTGGEYFSERKSVQIVVTCTLIYFYLTSMTTSADLSENSCKWEKKCFCCMKHSTAMTLTAAKLKTTFQYFPRAVFNWQLIPFQTFVKRFTRCLTCLVCSGKSIYHFEQSWFYGNIFFSCGPNMMLAWLSTFVLSFVCGACFCMWQWHRHWNFLKAQIFAFDNHAKCRLV